DTCEQGNVARDCVARGDPELHLGWQLALERRDRRQRQVTVRFQKPRPLALVVETQGLRAEGDPEAEGQVVAERRWTGLALGNGRARVSLFLGAELHAERGVDRERDEAILREQPGLARDGALA